MTGLGLDLLLLVLVVAILVMFYRLERRSLPPTDPEASSSGTAAATPGGLRRLFYYRRLARQAGFDPESLLWAYWLLKLALALLLPLLLLEIAARFAQPASLWLTVLLALVGFFLVDLWLWRRRARRKRRILIGLSFFLDLLVSLLHSGLNLEEAFHRAAEEGLETSHPLSREVRLVDRELAAGKERGAAFAAMAPRTGVVQFNAVAAALRLGSRLGNSVRETLSDQADLIRLQRRELARREIVVAPVKTILPILLCGLPVFAVLVLFPALLELFRTLREIGLVLSG